MAGEAGYDPFGGVTGEGGAASIAGCTSEDAANFRVFTVSPTGSVVCFGPAVWCDKVSEGARPVILSVDQLRELVGDAESE